jgi:hypothetical protein
VAYQERNIGHPDNTVLGIQALRYLVDNEAHLKDPTRVRAWKRVLLGKGFEASKALEALATGNEIELNEGIPQLFAADLETRLRRFLALIDRAIQRVSVDRFGRCAVCATPIAHTVLDERPWTERCGAHAV